MFAQQKKVFISCTSIDLPDHHKQSNEACQHMGYLLVGFEIWTALDTDAVTVCLQQIYDRE